VYDLDDLIQLSALQHFVFCERQCALIHIEQVWAENRLTAEGRVIHERVHEENRESRGNIRIQRGVSLRSLRLGLVGKADLVEFHRTLDGSWRPFPIEYKRGKPKPDHSDMVQLCAQALCLEEMMDVQIPIGALFYGRTCHRSEVRFDAGLRRETEDIVGRVRSLIATGKTPKAVYEKRCNNCSIVALCLPKAMQKKRPVASYMKRIMAD